MSFVFFVSQKCYIINVCCKYELPYIVTSEGRPTQSLAVTDVSRDLVCLFETGCCCWYIVHDRQRLTTKQSETHISKRQAGSYIMGGCSSLWDYVEAWRIHMMILEINIMNTTVGYKKKCIVLTFLYRITKLSTNIQLNKACTVSST